MNVTDLIAPEQVIAGLRVAGKAELLHELARRAAKALGIDQSAIETALAAREEMGSTGVGQGVAIPHARIAKLDRFYALFARLAKPIDFHAVDEQPVDLVILLLSPDAAGNDHLAALACVSRRLRDAKVARGLRAAGNAPDLFRVLSAPAS
jgi:PTS system nitrogen regulatory IIA component